MIDTTWPPAWTLKPTVGDPESGRDDEGAPESVVWDIGWGFTLNVSHDDQYDSGTPLTIGAHFSDADQARGFVKRQVTPEQLEAFAARLASIAANGRRTVGGAR